MEGCKIDFFTSFTLFIFDVFYAKLHVFSSHYAPFYLIFAWQLDFVRLVFYALRQ